MFPSHKVNLLWTKTQCNGEVLNVIHFLHNLKCNFTQYPSLIILIEIYADKLDSFISKIQYYFVQENEILSIMMHTKNFSMIKVLPDSFSKSKCHPEISQELELSISCLCFVYYEAVMKM